MANTTLTRLTLRRWHLRLRVWQCTPATSKYPAPQQTRTCHISEMRDPSATTWPLSRSGGRQAALGGGSQTGWSQSVSQTRDPGSRMGPHVLSQAGANCCVSKSAAWCPHTFNRIYKMLRGKVSSSLFQMMLSCLLNVNLLYHDHERHLNVP